MLLLLRLTASLCEGVPLLYGFYPLCRKQQQQSWNDKKFWILLEWLRGSLFWQQLASECYWMPNKVEHIVCSPWGIILNLHMRGISKEPLSARHVQYLHPLQKAMPEWSCDLCHVFRESPITCVRGLKPIKLFKVYARGLNLLQNVSTRSNTNISFFNKYFKMMQLGLHKRTTSLLTVNYGIMGNEGEIGSHGRILLAPVIVIWRSQLLQTNNRSLTHSVFLACWVSTELVFIPCRKKGLPCLAAGDAIWYEWGLCDHRIASLVKRWNYYCTTECRSFATATWPSDRCLERAVVVGLVSPPVLPCVPLQRSPFIFFKSKEKYLFVI